MIQYFFHKEKGGKMAGYSRKFSSIEQALKETIKDLGRDKIKELKQSEGIEGSCYCESQS